MKNRRFLPLIIPLILLLMNEIFLFQPHLFFIILALGVLIILLSVKEIGRDNQKKFWLLFSLLPILLFFSFSLMAALISNPFLIQIIFIGLAFMLFLYLRNLYYYLVFSEIAQAAKLDTFSTVSGFFIVFAVFASISVLPSFLDLAPALMVLAVVPAVCFLFFQSIIFNEISFKKSAVLFLIDTFILFQLSWIFSFFPLQADILGFLSAIIYYLLLIISRLSLKGELKRQTLKWPIFLSALAVFVLLLTARWL